MSDRERALAIRFVGRVGRRFKMKGIIRSLARSGGRV